MVRKSHYLFSRWFFKTLECYASSKSPNILYASNLAKISFQLLPSIARFSKVLKQALK